MPEYPIADISGPLSQQPPPAGMLVNWMPEVDAALRSLLRSVDYAFNTFIAQSLNNRPRLRCAVVWGGVGGEADLRGVNDMSMQSGK